MCYEVRLPRIYKKKLYFNQWPLPYSVFGSCLGSLCVIRATFQDLRRITELNFRPDPSTNLLQLVLKDTNFIFPGKKTFTFHDQGGLNFPPKPETNMAHDSSGDVWIHVRILKRLRNGFWIGTMIWTICFERFMANQPEKKSSNCNFKKLSCSSPSAPR